ncbi:MAG: hypothetical protein JW944_00030, partial [Deltaproteobacteria bacterium]|nr:hypothetical protein [Deltaproteobacteria bacterium]
HQGSTPLYWEDVVIGDQPAITMEGPVESNPAVAVPWGMGLGGNQTLKKYIMDPDVFKTLVRSGTDGIYRPANKEDYILSVPDEARTGFRFGEMGEMDAVLSGAPGASGDAPASGAPGGEGGGGGMGGGGMMNFSRRDYAIRHFIDWMGDSGWLYNIRWGGLYSRDMAARGGVVPAVNPEAHHWLEEAKVPEAVTAPLYPLGQGNGDSKFLIVRSYVYDKYVLNGEFFVELGWWIETMAGSNFGEGAATIRLPSKKAN